MNKLKSFKDQIANFEEKKWSNLQLSWGQKHNIFKVSCHYPKFDYFLHIKNVTLNWVIIEQLKAQKFYILNVRRKIISPEALILHLQGKDLDESLKMMEKQVT